MNNIQHDLVVIGAGPAGMAAAVSAYDEGITDVVIIERDNAPGGILQQCIHNGFGLHKLGKELTGPEYAAVYAEKVRERGIKVYYSTMVLSVNKDKEVRAQNSTDGIITFKAKAVILAMGCRERSRGALNIPGSRPAGVYSAGTAQKLINCEGYAVGKKAVILGSGDIGLIMARRMTFEGAKVEAVCEIMPYSGGLVRNIVQCLEDYNIPLYLSHTVSQIHGKKRVEGVTIAKVDENKNPIPGTERYIECDTLLLSCGLIPENELTSAAGIAIDGITKGAVVNQDRQTDTEGIFSCGNVLQVHDLVDYVSDEAELAGKGAAKYIRGETECTGTLEVKASGGVRYVLPQKISLPANEDVALFMRVTQPFGKVKIFALDEEGNLLASKISLKAAPGEMEKLVVKKSVLENVKGSIKVTLEEMN